MFDNNNLGAQILANPGLMQNNVLAEISNRMNGTIVIADPNNGFNLHLEANASMVAQAVRYMESKFDAQYPALSTTSDELSNHMSDFDYLNMTAKPASTYVKLTFDKDYLTRSAVVFDTDYLLVTIPSDTVVTIGTRAFGLYYPISIKINRKTNNVVVVYDNSYDNPLHVLASNVVNVTEFTYANLNLMMLYFPVYQFARSIDVVDVIAEQGFTKAYSFSNQFYACRVYTNTTAGNWSELSQTLSEDIYDTSSPTAKIKLLQDANAFKVSIPQIYFDKGVIGNQIKIETYTTEGSLDVNISNVDASACTIEFNPTNTVTSPYSVILNNLPTLSIIPDGTNIVGGSNSLTFTELRKRVISGSLYSKVPITPTELDAFVSDEGFVLSKYLDNVTDRIYYGSRTMINTANNTTIPVTTANIVIDSNKIGTTSSILHFTNDGAVTVLPTTVYKYNSTNNSCVPLTDTDLTILNAKSKAELANQLNNIRYCKSPFHIVTYTNPRYPISKSFDLLDPKVNSIQFIRENVHLSAQMTIASTKVVHLNNGTGGYVIRLGVSKTTDMSGVAESNIRVVATLKDKTGRIGYMVAKRTGSIGSIETYDIKIDTSYNITQDDFFESSLFFGSDVKASTCYLPLDSTLTVYFMCTPESFPGVGNDPTITTSAPPVYSSLLAVAEQHVSISFGKDLSGGIYNITDANWAPQVYERHLETVYHTYPKDVYKTNPDGSLVYTIDSHGALSLTKLHSTGDFVLDIDGNKQVKYHIGDIKFDSVGNPIVSTNRSVLYYVSAMMFDARIFFSDLTEDTTYASAITTEISAYVDTLATVNDNLLERTNLYFKPNRTMGTTTYSLGNSVTTTLDLSLGFVVKYYVLESTLKDAAIIKMINVRTTSIIESYIGKEIISIVDMAAEMRAVLKDQILSVDVLGINGDEVLQTLIPLDTAVKPSVALKLNYDESSETLSLKKDITIVYAIDD